MIILELKAIGINILFGIFSATIISAISFFIDKYNKPILSNIIYFITTVFLGILYIVYIDLIFFVFNFYYLLFIILGFILSSKINWLNIKDRLPLFVFIAKVLLKFLKNLLLFMINYKLWIKIIEKFKK
jgi:hypothetical protein